MFCQIESRKQSKRIHDQKSKEGEIATPFVSTAKLIGEANFSHKGGKSHRRWSDIGCDLPIPSDPVESLLASVLGSFTICDLVIVNCYAREVGMSG